MCLKFVKKELLYIYGWLDSQTAMELVSDVDLWNKFRKGDRHAFALIYKIHIAELLSYGYRVTSNQQLIKDSIQDLFLHIWLHRGNLSETTSIKYYLFRSLRNRILQNLDTAPEVASQPNDFTLDGILSEISWEEELIQEETQTSQMQRLRKAIERLPKRQQEAIQLRYFHSFGLDEISTMMEMNNQSVRNLLHRAITHLRGLLELAGLLVIMVKSFLFAS